MKTNMNREIFEFEYKGTTKKVDPLLVHFALLDDPEFEVERDSVTIDALAKHDGKLDADRDSRESIGRISRAVGRAFGVQAFDGETGMTLTESLELLFQFLHWQAKVKKNIGRSQMPPEFTDATSPESSASTTSVTSR